MMKEYPNVRQVPGSFRRLFSDEAFDLWVWYDEPGSVVVGFQLVILGSFGPRNEDTVFTWTAKDGAMFTGLLDEGHSFKKTQFLAVNGRMNKDVVVKKWAEHGASLPGPIQALVDRELTAFEP